MKKKLTDKELIKQLKKDLNNALAMYNKQVKVTSQYHKEIDFNNEKIFELKQIIHSCELQSDLFLVNSLIGFLIGSVVIGFILW